jgi:hypothetical protein
MLRVELVPATAKTTCFSESNYRPSKLRHPMPHAGPCQAFFLCYVSRILSSGACLLVITTGRLVTNREGVIPFVF